MGTLVNNDSTSRLRKGWDGSASSCNLLLRSMESRRCAGEKDPKRGVRMLAKCLERGFEYDRVCETMGLKAMGSL